MTNQFMNLISGDKEENSSALDETKKQKNWDVNFLPCDDNKDG